MVAKLYMVEILIVQLPFVAIGQDNKGNRYVAGYDGNKIYVTINHEIYRIYDANDLDWENVRKQIIE